MPTMPVGRELRPVEEPHQRRQIAESFGSDPDRYDRTRPSYPQAVVERILAAIPGLDVLDVGCGTGVSARPFQAAGCQVLGVEVDERMAAFARRQGLEVEVATFEAWKPCARIFDAVISGQAWHWVDPLIGAAKAADVLRPDGRLAIFWNVQQPPCEQARAFSEVYRRVVPDSPFSRGTMYGLEAYSAFLTKAAEGIAAAEAFDETEQWQFDWERPYTREEWLEQVPTFGGHSRFSPAELEELLDGIGAVIHAVGGSFTMHYTAMVLTTRRSTVARRRTRDDLER